MKAKTVCAVTAASADAEVCCFPFNGMGMGMRISMENETGHAFILNRDLVILFAQCTNIDHKYLTDEKRTEHSSDKSDILAYIGFLDCDC